MDPLGYLLTFSQSAPHHFFSACFSLSILFKIEDLDLDAPKQPEHEACATAPEKDSLLF